MGNTESGQANHLKSHNVPIKLPRPDDDVLDVRFEEVLVSMFSVMCSSEILLVELDAYAIESAITILAFCTIGGTSNFCFCCKLL